MNCGMICKNFGTPASSTTLSVDTFFLTNFNQVQTAQAAKGDPTPVRITEETHSIYGKLETVETTADQVVLQYTVPVGKAFFMLGFSISNSESSVSAKPFKVGRNTVTSEPSSPGTMDGNIFRAGILAAQASWTEDYSANPRRIANSGDVVKVTVTPTGKNSTVWRSTLDFVLR
jgi:hypothetical protein